MMWVARSAAACSTRHAGRHAVALARVIERTRGSANGQTFDNLEWECAITEGIRPVPPNFHPRPSGPSTTPANCRRYSCPPRAWPGCRQPNLEITHRVLRTGDRTGPSWKSCATIRTVDKASYSPLSGHTELVANVQAAPALIRSNGAGSYVQNSAAVWR